MGKSRIQNFVNRVYARVMLFCDTMETIQDILDGKIVPEFENRKMQTTSEQRNRSRPTLKKMLTEGKSISAAIKEDLNNNKQSEDEEVSTNTCCFAGLFSFKKRR